MWILLLIAAVVAVVLWIRFAPSDPAVWHVDPETVTKTRRPNQYLLGRSPDADGPPVQVSGVAADVAAAFDAAVMGRPGVSRLAGDAASGHVTYVQRTKVMGYPDFVSVKFGTSEGNTEVSIYSRSRFGHRDFGVNKARVGKWLKLLAA